MFAKIKAALVHALGLGEAEVHAVITAIEEDAKPLAAQFEASVVAAVENALAAGKIDVEAFAKAVAAEVAKILGKAPTEPPAAG